MTELERNLLDLLTADTAVPRGETEILAGDARIAAAVDGVVLPIIEGLEPDEIRRHPAGDIAVRFGPDRDDGLLLQTYIVSQHGNLMAQPHAARVVDGSAMGLEGPTAVGQGANQNKGPMAAAMDALRGRGTLTRPVWLTVNTEGRSSHDGSRRILDDLEVTAAHGILAFGTDLRISLGNRGRVDVEVVVHGVSSHSSQPDLGRNPIPEAAALVAALAALDSPDPHPILGAATTTVYQFSCEPIAPHTLPARVRMVIDRRLLPGEDAAAAVRQLREHLGARATEVVVREGVVMLPAAVDAGAPVVTALTAAGALGSIWSRNTFDAGYACSRGIPTVMFGPGRRSFGSDVTATEAVSFADCRRAADVLRGTIASLCG
jgi:succinyl-diaminopimelate desuccinylase